MCSDGFVESVRVTKLIVESILCFTLYKPVCGVCRLHKIARNKQIVAEKTQRDCREK